jgi:transcriptional regulator with XRE-family HTH domain
MKTAARLQIEASSSEPSMIGRRVIADRTYHRVSRELMAARMRARLMQKQVASRMGTTASAISRLENAAGYRPTLTTLERYAQAVGCRLEIRLVSLP